MTNTPEEEWFKNFQSHSVQVGFRLYLTKPMLEFLCATADDCYWDRWKYGNITFPDNFIATEHSLKKRGLIVRKPPEEVTAKTKKDWLQKSKHPCYCKLTPAGRAVVELLKVGGLFLKAEDALGKMHNRRGRN